MHLHPLIAQGENAAIEFKLEDVRAESLAKELVAFANTQGGVILIGVEDNGTITGVSNTALLEEKIANVCRNNVIPPIDCSIQTVIEDHKHIIAVTVPKGKDKPYQTMQHHFLIRIGSTNRTASHQELMRLFQQSGMFHFDLTQVPNTKLESFDLSKLDRYFDSYGFSFSEEPNKLGLLENVDVCSDGQATVAGCLLFGINPQKYLHNASISFAHFKGRTIGDELFDKQLIEGTLNEQIDKALTVIKHNIAQPSIIAEGKREATVPAYPDKVFRELLVNAVVHRDYSITGSRIRILMFENRIEFISPGRLPNTIMIEKLKYGVSFSRNPVILKFLENMRYVDKLGRGLPMVWQEAHRLGRDVLFEEIGEEFKVTLALPSA